MKLRDYVYDGKRPLILAKAETKASNGTSDMKDELILRTEENLERVSVLQDRLYADAREGLVVVLQGMDASGKDSAVKHVIGAINPQGVDVHSFKAPSAQELSHDYLWRIFACLPARGRIAIFNRSHYEDVLAVGVLKLYQNFRLPERCLGTDFIEKRLSQIARFEEYLYDNGIRMLKLFLNVSKDEQKARLLERIAKPEKNWKFSPDDLEARARWADYQAAYEHTINLTATARCPWYVLPADNKWFTRYLISEALLDSLQAIDPHYPVLTDAARARLPEMRKRLTDEV